MTAAKHAEDIVAKVKEQADIVQVISEVVDLRRSGVRYLGLCPFHGEKTPSFSVHPGNQFFHCFGCGESGDVISFVMKHQGTDFPSALEYLAGKYGIPLPRKTQSKKAEQERRRRQELHSLLGKTAEIYSQILTESPLGGEARRYLKERGIDSALARRFGLGYAPAAEKAGWNFLGSQLTGAELEGAMETGLLAKRERGGTYDRFRDRVLFPIMTIGGQVCGFGGRIIGEGQPKYMNSPESLVYDKSRQLLGLYQNREQIRKNNRAVIVEGNFDMLVLVAHGCDNVVAPLGTALTREQLRLVKRFTEEAILLFDGDQAGKKAALRSVPLFLAEQLTGRVALLPEGHDPDSFVRSHGLAELTKLLESAVSLPEFFLGELIDRYGLDLDGKRRIVEELVPLVQSAASTLQKQVFIAHFAERLAMPASQLEGLLGGGQPPQREQPPLDDPALRLDALSLAQKQLLEYLILHPDHYQQLATAGIRGFLTGTIGEMLCLELERLLKTSPEVDPEELLTQLPEGAERRFVATLLARPTPGHDQGPEPGLGDQLDYLRMVRLKKKAAELQQQIDGAQQAGDNDLLRELMVKKVEVTRELHQQNHQG
jgi:DNA primase